MEDLVLLAFSEVVAALVLLAFGEIVVALVLVF